MNRRSILSLVMGVPAAGAMGITPKQVAAMASPAVMSGTFAETAGVCPTQDCSIPADWPRRIAVMNMLEDRASYLRWDSRNIPPHIASKRSWSPAFKHSEARRELREIQELITRLHEDKDLWDRLADAFLG